MKSGLGKSANMEVYYQTLVKDGLFETMKDVMLTAIALGFVNNSRVPINKYGGDAIKEHIFKDDIDFLNIIAVLTTKDIKILLDENKEEGRQQVRCEFTVLRTDTALYNIIVHHHDKHLHKPDETTGSGTSLRVLAIPVRHTQNDEKQQCAVDEQRQCHLRDGDVQRAYFVSGGIILHQLAFVLASCGSDGKAFITSTVLLQT